MTVAIETKAEVGLAAASRIDAAEPAVTNRHEPAVAGAAMLERHRLRGALLSAIVKNEARRRQIVEPPSMESVSTEGPANSRVEVVQT